ncbi:MAG: NADH-quinone oxidoreductase subunit NuoB [bacterium]|nr:NADH-quinone oxidoreductase subunit NuoB [bacterium]
MSGTSKSPWIIHYDGSSCNGCDIEVLACLTPMYDVERFGVINTGNPKHADVFLITGAVNERNIGVVKQIYSQMLEPKVVVACGACACSGGIFHDCYNVIGGVDKAIPVDVYVPGCAVRPEALIDAVVAGLGALEEKRAALELASSYEAKELAKAAEQERLAEAASQPLLEEPAKTEEQTDIDINADEEPGE